ncbi:TrmH family RNA methyltransferase [Bifidobacterium eulemuris]|uniref:RNA methyltransferase n=1 Tax=Bifidobacterium eulemuris TaxID=1765219 RepID=A0A261GBV8_9BIFI|nr:RNA methyltransferase [Bifidobacterium eulemuris]OZG68902.1 rRNA methyltransferase [Bifidobacterium eulemuris]QOL31559.1 RNA methyltransferase [Bifidobacterium eulemuris]
MPINAQLVDNPKSERVRHLADLTNRKTRYRAGRFLIEGPQSVREAVVWRPDVVRDLYVEVAAEGGERRAATDTLQRIVDQALESDVYVHWASGEVIRRISADAQGILAVGDIDVIRSTATVPPAVETGTPGTRLAAFWQVRDPGNAGTVIRAADAAGCDAVVFVDDCVDVFNPKVVRSTAGSLFHVPVVVMRTDEFLAWAGGHGIKVIAADVYGTEERKSRPLPDVLAERSSTSGASAVLFGNEARGLPPDVLERADDIVSIPLYGKAESLNLATSAAVMLMSLAMASHA